MVYLINQIILFNEGDGTLAWRDREDETVSLSAPLARILTTLIDNVGVTMSRELLLHETLEKYALSSSMNNLNNYISLLRKVLREFDLADAIVTIPKTGILFTVDSIEIFSHKGETVPVGAELCTSELLADVDSIPAEPTPLSASPQAAEIPVKRPYPVKIILAIGILVLFILLAAVFTSRFPYRPLVKVKVPEKCHVYSLQDPVKREAMVGYRELCAENTLFFMAKKSGVTGALMKQPRVLISCTRQGKGCVTYADY